MLRVRASAAIVVAPNDVPTTTSACAHASCAASGARNGPAGITRPLPRPRRASTTSTARSLVSDGFWKPSSITITLAPADDRGRSPLGTRARHDGGRDPGQQERLVPDLAGAMAFRIDPQRAGQLPAITAGEERRPLAMPRSACARPPAPSASCRRRRRSRLPTQTTGTPAPRPRRLRRAPPPRHRRRQAARAAARQSPASCHQNAGSRIGIGMAAFKPNLHQIGLERRDRAIERAAEQRDGLACRRNRAPPAPPHP